MQKSLHLRCVCLHQWRIPQFALKYPCNPSPPGEGLSLGDRLPPGRETVARYGGGGGISRGGLQCSELGPEICDLKYGQKNFCHSPQGCLATELLVRA